MKIGILTQRLYVNYGGLLQCFALQTTLRSLGHEAEVLQRWFPQNKNTFRNRLVNHCKQLFFFMLYRKWYHYITESERRKISQHTSYFIEKYICPRSPRFFHTASMKQYVEKNGFEGYVVGSDQVWRPCYSPCIGNYFLDFTIGKNVRRVSYAASFGVDSNEYTDAQLKKFAPMLHLFNSVSVREKSGINLCNDYFHSKAQLVLDPTMLLEKEDYERLIVEENEPKSSGNLFCYFLDKTPEKLEVVRELETKQFLKSFRVMPKRTDTENLCNNTEDYIYPSVTKWLRGFKDSEMVLTDSFHGCVFSIIFNKPFWVIGNEGRGNARFHSLLSLFGLENRLLTPSRLAEIDWTMPVDWQKVNGKREAMKQESLQFLTNALKKN